jgi:hypothetical protein
VERQWLLKPNPASFAQTEKKAKQKKLPTEILEI